MNMEIVLDYKDKIELNTYLQLLATKDGISLQQNGVEIVRASWEQINTAQREFKKIEESKKLEN